MRGACFGNGAEALQNIEGVMHALSQVPVDLAAWCRRESVKGGGRDALNGVWGRRRKQRQRPPFSAAFPWILAALPSCNVHSSFRRDSSRYSNFRKILPE